VARSAQRISSVLDAERRAKRRIPKSVYQAFASGSGDQLTLDDNLRAFREVGFRPRVAVYHEKRELATSLLGVPLAMPVIVSPIGILRLAHREAEVGFARAADAMGIPVGVSTMSSRPIEEIAAATSSPVWYQLYLAGGRGAVEGAIERARAAGCSVLLLTVDLLGVSETPSPGAARNQIPTKVTLANALRYFPELVVRPRWFADYAREGLKLEAANVRPSPTDPPLPYSEALPLTPTWDDISWIAAAWQGPIVVKGITRPDDARRAVDAGADAIVVSNHGAKVLDGVPGSLRALPAVLDAVGSQVEVLLDGGVRTGADVVKAIALGARAVLCGRSCIWGLAAGGSQGVQRVLEIIRDGIDRTLAELGIASVHDLEIADLDLPALWPARTGAR
jgi:isopentenyl diphosphate isomerase/L-lactate dehydrogenase-like FMN-dependent dehydrogenase